MQMPIPGFSKHRASEGGVIYGIKGNPLSGHTNPKGYLVVCIRSDEGIQRPQPVHRLVASAFHGPCPDGMECRHLDGNKTNNSAGNLAWGSHRENITDKTRHGTMAVGAKNFNTKLTEGQVRTIRQLRIEGITFPAIAEQFGVSHQLIQYICKRTIWRHVA